MVVRRVLICVVGAFGLLAAACGPPPDPNDTTAPILTLPGDITQSADNESGAEVTFAVTALDDVDGALQPECEPPSGEFFTVGATVVTCTATDTAGNSAVGDFTVTITEYEPPTGSAVTAGGFHTCGLISDGTARCWGRNGDGQLGNGTTAGSSVPVPVSELTDAIAITAGDHHSCALIDDGSARCWGSNGVGQLGDSTTVDSPVPVTVTGLSGATAITAGANHTCALIDNGTARCWGYNQFGQLGNNGAGPIHGAPVVVTGLFGATDITAGANHTCATIDDGTARCWGENTWEQLGDGTVVDSTAPVAVSGVTAVTDIAAGSNHTCATIDDGTARCWGENFWGQLGHGTIVDFSSVPVTVTDLGGAIAVAAGASHTCALSNDGTSDCWGKNTSGELGTGAIADPQFSPVPLPVSELAGADAITADADHNCALISDGTISCWGSNGDGQLGDGTTTHSSVPMVVTGLP